MVIEGTNICKISQTIPSVNNTSGAIGVSWRPDMGKWRVRLSFKGETLHLGHYDKIEDAIAARKKAEDEIYKPFLEEIKKKSAGNKT
jgi:hypothetical protein